MTKRVAIIGAAYRFPGADSIEAFSQALQTEQDLVTEVASDRWDANVFQHPDRKHPGTTVSMAAGSLGDISGFDADFFGISPREAAQLDPQQRLMLELAWETLEHAGLPPSKVRGSDCGVYLGVAGLDYSWRLGEDLSIISTTTATSNTSSIVANRLSYFLDIHGPSLTVDTACSSAMVAFHQACQAIRSGETTTALTGGISIHLHPYGFIIFSKASMLSANGRCRSFDADGDGYVRSEGAGMFLLKDYDQAVADGDRILAVVAGSGINTDGSKQGLTVPNHAAQTALMQRTLNEAGLNANDISYLEAHGTGTAIGDPIEVRAIGEAIGEQRNTPLPIGSVKSNVGHMETASGIAGLAKALHVITEREIPATIGIRTLNPKLESEKRNIEVITERRPLAKDGRLVVGINSFGFGGANAHVLLETPPEEKPLSSSPAPSSQNETIEHSGIDSLLLPKQKGIPLKVSARSPEALQAQAASLASFLQEQYDAWQQADDDTNDQEFLGSVASELWYRRESFPHGLLVWPENVADAITALQSVAEDTSSRWSPIGERPISIPKKGAVFVYSGNGCQWFTMGHELLQHSDEFASIIDHIDTIFIPLAGFSLREELDGVNGDRLELTEVAQPTLFALQVGITQLLEQHGIVPAAVVGHSVGEVAAAWACGALSLEQAVNVIYWRSLHQGKTKGKGAMMAATVTQQELRQWLQDERFSDIELAGRNSATGVTLAGPSDQIHSLAKALTKQRHFAKALPLDYAFHSAAMDSIEGGLLADLDWLTPSATTRCPMFSSVTGAQIDGSELTAEYWWENIRQPVMFHPALQALIGEGFSLFTEIGAHPVLHRYITDTLSELEQTGLVIDTLSRPKGGQAPHDSEYVNRAIARLWLSGLNVPVEHWLNPKAPRIDLPHYAWQRIRHWYQNSGDGTGVVLRHYEHPLLGYRLAGQPLTWQSELDTQRLPWLADHDVGNSPIFPAAGFVELALAAAASWHETAHIELEAIEIISPLLLGASPSKEVRLAIDDTDGSLTIKAKETASKDPWHLHSRARILPQTLGLSLAKKAPTTPTRAPDFNRESHIAAAHALGLNYGEAFQGVATGWVEQDRIVGILEQTTVISSTQSDCLLPPGMLDSAFQLFIPLLTSLAEQSASDIRQGDTQRGIAFVPVRLERMQFNVTDKQVHLAELRLTQRSPFSLCADIDLFDDEGNAIATIHEARFKAVQLHAQGKHEIHHLAQTMIPRPLSAEAQSLLPVDHPTVSRETSSSDTSEANADSSRWLSDAQAAHTRMSEELDPLLNAFVHAALYEAVPELPEGRIKHQLAHLAEQFGLMEGSDIIAPAAPSQDIWQIAFHDYPEYAHITMPLSRAITQLKQNQPANINPALLWQAAIGSDLWHVLTSHIERTLSQALPPHGAEGIVLIEVAREKLECLPRITPPKIETGYQECALVLDEHAHHDARTIAETRTTLQVATLDSFTLQTTLPALVVIDAGISDSQLRRVLEQLDSQVLGSVQLLFTSPATSNWQSLLLAPGLIDSERLPASRTVISDLLVTYDYQLEKQDVSVADDLPLIHAHRPSRSFEVAQSPEGNRWLVISDDATTPFASQLIEALEAHHQVVDHQQEFDSVDKWQTTQTFMPQHILDLRLLGSEPAQRCAIATDWWQWIEAQDENIQLWLMTIDATAKWSHPESGNENTSLAEDAALWGFGRTLQNEAGSRKVRLVDLPSTVFVNEVIKVNRLLASVGAHLLIPDEELEVAFNQDGDRYVPRLVETSPEIENRSQQALTLGFDIPGQLHHLRWAPRTLSTLGDTDVEIEVKATGLNFRDVMYALGLLSDEAVEEGFAGASLGLEFSGRVVRVGAAVERFKAGDAIVGFGPHSFSTRLIAAQHSIAKIPQGMDYAAAATLPTTFFTVYYSLKHQAQLEAGERLLIHGAAGGVGLAAIQIGQWLGADIYTTAGSDAKRDVLRWLGVEHIYDSRSTTFAEALLADTDDGRGVDVILNSLAGEAIHQNLRALNPFGRFIELGKRDFYENTKVGLRPFRNNLSYFGVDSDQLMNLRPALTERLFGEMMALFEEGILTPLPYTAFAADRAIDAFRFMQQAKQIGKVVITYDQAPKAATLKATHHALSLNESGAFLVTGGLSGFGLATAHWLADCGAKHLVLVSRRGAQTDEAKSGVEALKAKGITVTVEACDITDRDALDRVLKNLRDTAIPLKGVVHAATIIDDALVRDLDEERITRAMNAKVEGARLLDELTRQDDLELFILFSSATTLFGNPGQASYIAANSWLESLAAHRQQQGLPATCVEWGAIEDVGFLARNTQTRDALTQRLGGSSLLASEALSELAQLVESNTANEGILPLDWSAMSRFLPTATAPRFSLLKRGDDKDSNVEEEGQLRDQLAQLSPEALKQALIKLLRKELATILLSEEDAMDIERPIHDMGFDSLMGVELVTALEASIGIQVPVMILNDSATINKLADYLTDRLSDDSEDDDAISDEERQAKAQSELEARHGIVSK